MSVERRRILKIGRFRAEFAGYVSNEAPKFSFELFIRRRAIDLWLCCWRAKANVYVAW